MLIECRRIRRHRLVPRMKYSRRPSNTYAICFLKNQLVHHSYFEWQIFKCSLTCSLMRCPSQAFAFLRSIDPLVNNKICDNCVRVGSVTQFEISPINIVRFWLPRSLRAS